MHHPVLYQQLPAIAAPTRPSRNFSSLLRFCLSLSSIFSLPLSSSSSFIAALCRFRRGSFFLVSFPFSVLARFPPRSVALFRLSLSSRRCLSFISSVSAATSLPTIRALVFPRHSSTAAVVAGPSPPLRSTLPNAEIPFYAHRVTHSGTVTSFAVRPVISMRIQAGVHWRMQRHGTMLRPPVERRRKEPRGEMGKAERASVARIVSVKNGNRISIIS